MVLQKSLDKVILKVGSGFGFVLKKLDPDPHC